VSIKKVLSRKVSFESELERIKEDIIQNLPADIKLFNEYHALLVRLGKNFCRPKAKCPYCPLKNLPHSLNLNYQ